MTKPFISLPSPLAVTATNGYVAFSTTCHFPMQVQKGTPAPPTCFPFKLLLEALAADQDDLECLGVENGDAIWLKWVDKHLKEK